MIAALDILDEVETDAVALNGEVVRRAFNGHCCRFFNNQREFKRTLDLYTHYRLKIHHLKIQEDKAWRREWNEPWVVGNLRPDHYQLHQLLHNARSLRLELKRIWPCAACVWIYNPTKRTKKFPQLA